MGLSTKEKAKLATYQLKGVAHTWFVRLRDYTSLRGGSVTWEVFKKAFLDRFFFREKREVKVVEFFDLHQGGIIVLEYTLKFPQLSKYAPFFVSNPRDEMNRFVTGGVG
ncbi:hypothetical protein, partial [Acinetobacter baumannii]|uniref:hypothetical protein n=1 Tax=Acinetobacter baumannii TaxID=470 RepID=UPI003395C500